MRNFIEVETMNGKDRMFIKLSSIDVMIIEDVKDGIYKVLIWLSGEKNPYEKGFADKDKAMSFIGLVDCFQDEEERRTCNK